MSSHPALQRWKKVASVALLCLIMVLPVWFLLPGAPRQPLEDADSVAVPMGKGAGVFGHDSLFAPLQARADVVPWSLLTAVSTRVENNRVVTVYPPAVQALNHKLLRIQGYMMPLNAGEQHSHFLVSSVPLTCPFCTPGGPESMVEVSTREPLRYTMDAVVVEGDFAVLADDPTGLYYRMGHALSVK